MAELGGDEYQIVLAKYVDELRKANSKTQEDLEKNFLTLSVAIVGVLLTFRLQILGNVKTQVGFPPMLWATITLFALCILAVLTSYLLSLWTNSRIVIAATTGGDTDRAFRRTNLTKVFNGVAALLFYAGFGAAAIFIYQASKVH